MDRTFAKIVESIKNDQYDFFRFKKIDVESVIREADKINGNYDNVVIVGFGSSSLNVMAILSSARKPAKNVIYLDSLDRLEISEKLKNINRGNSVFFVLSKSGNTHETYILTKYLISLRYITPNNSYIICPISKNLLFSLSDEHGLTNIEHAKVESGRFGIISTSSLLPCCILGVDIRKIALNANKALSQFLENGEEIIQKADAYIDNYLAGKRTLVTFNYCYQLDGLCRWQQQLIAESLGKKGFGITPIIARGTFDQHSQLQLYLEGPNDKFFTVIFNEKESIENEVLVHVNNIYKSFIDVNRPVTIQNFDQIDENIISREIVKTLLLTMTIATKQKFNPFDQPSVDKYKRLNLTF